MLKAKQSAPEESMQFLLYKATRRVWTSTADIPPWLADAETDLEPKDSSQRTTTLAFSDVHMAVHRTYQIRQQNMLSSDHSFERRFYVGVKEHHLGFSPNPTKPYLQAAFIQEPRNPKVRVQGLFLYTHHTDTTELPAPEHCPSPPLLARRM